METITVVRDTNIQRTLKAVDGYTHVDDDDEEDETFSERLFALTEMFPESVRSAACRSASFVASSAVSLFLNSKKVAWIGATSAAILVLPVMFETERAQIEEQQLQQQRQILLGPTAAVSGGQNLMPGLMQMPQPQQK